MVFPEGYRAMLAFLDRLWRAQPLNGLGALLGAMAVDTFGGGLPADSAFEEDWARAVEEASGAENRLHDPELAYRAALCFLRGWLAAGHDEDIAAIYRDMAAGKHAGTWNEAVREVFGSK